jgi:hypothetical protein
MKGRTFDDHDRLDAEEVTIISRSLAQRYWPNSDPVGARISGDGGDSWIRIVGAPIGGGSRALRHSPIARAQSLEPLHDLVALTTRSRHLTGSRRRAPRRRARQAGIDVRERPDPET